MDAILFAFLAVAFVAVLLYLIAFFEEIGPERERSELMGVQIPFRGIGLPTTVDREPTTSSSPIRRS